MRKVEMDNNMITIISPYESVNWSSCGQYKAGLHVHTSNSWDVKAWFGNTPLSTMIEQHYSIGYDILAITEHSVLTKDWVSAENGLSGSRFAEIATGAGRDGRGMLQIPYTNEQNKDTEHINTFFTNYNGPDDGSLKDVLKKVQELGGLSHINHPGKEYRGDAVNDPAVIQKYVDLLIKYSTCMGIEMVSGPDHFLDQRILWDNMLTQTIPQNRYVWGFANDDSHAPDGIGNSFEIFLMERNTQEHFKRAMYSGGFYAVSKYSKNELGSSFNASGPTPAIKNIVVDQEAVITVTAENATKIEWISEGKVVAAGASIDIKNLGAAIGCYVRANISGPGGIAYTQPFGIKMA